MVDCEEETQQGRRVKITQVYKQLGWLTRLKRLTLGCNVLGESSKVELDFILETGLQTMELCLKRMDEVNICRVEGKRFSQKESEWLQQHALQGAMFYEYMKV